MEDQIKFTFHPDTSVTLKTHSSEAKCEALQADIVRALGGAFEAGRSEKLSSDFVKEEKVVANVHQG